MKIMFPTALFALVLASFLPSVMAKPEFLGHDLADTGSWSQDVDALDTIDYYFKTHLGDNNELKFDVSYINLGRVQNMYLALEKWHWDLGNATAQGTAPVQLLIQRYHSVGGRDVLALNAFTGLVAYRNNDSNVYGRPDKNSDLYYGWTMYGELLKNQTNGILENCFGIPDLYQFEKDAVGEATRIWDNTTTAGTVKFGMSYRNLFVFWQAVNIDVEPNGTAAGVPEANFGRAVAWSLLDSLNFTFTLTSTDLGDGKTAVSTSTSYEIGAIKDLWVREEGPTNVTSGGFTHSGAPSGTTIYLGHYNTTAAITNRLNGTDTTHGFSLGVMNYAIIIVLDQETQDDTWDGSATDVTNAPPVNDTSNISVQQLNLRVANRAAKAYNINFAAKPTYVLDGDTLNPLASPTYVYPKLKINPVSSRFLWDGTKWLVRRLWGTNFIGNYLARFDTAYVGDLVYITCFPRWEGKSCVQDPTFTAYTSLQGIDAYPLLFLGLAAVPALYFLVRKYRR